MTFQTATTPIVAVDTSLYSLSSKEAAFFKAQIGFDDDEDLKRHILEVQAKAYEASHS
jgi:thermostable 8-oxoguanine DNA glycosylase